MKQRLFYIRAGACSSLLAIVVMGCFGVNDDNRAKLPVAIIAGILGSAYFSRNR